MIINKSGIAIRMSVSEIRVAGRNTQGVRLIKLSESDEISSVTRIENEEAVVGEIVAGEEGTPTEGDAPVVSNDTATEE
jgi:DNA gyrase subunit A